MSPFKITRHPSADWRTENLHELWSKTTGGQFVSAEASLHSFLQYCILLRNVRNQFESDDQLRHFDRCAFLLRGGYFAFAYLNMTSSMAERATIFGGLNHGRHPKLELPKFLGELRDDARKMGKESAKLLITDEVKSGSGVGEILNLAEQSMNDWDPTSSFDLQIHIYAIRPGSENEMRDELRSVVAKWSGDHRTRGGLLRVKFHHFAATLLGYDSELLCGIRTVSKSGDLMEGYELAKLSGGELSLVCDITLKPVIFLNIDASCLVEFLSNSAVEWTSNDPRTLARILREGIEARGCATCMRFYLTAAGLQDPNS
jgi:hypothetical protein